jgi:hypothetical protein
VFDVSIKISIFYLNKIYLLFSHIFFYRLFLHTYISLYGRLSTMSQANWLRDRRHDPTREKARSGGEIITWYLPTTFAVRLSCS